MMDAQTSSLENGRPSRSQIRSLEAFFEICPHPDVNQRKELGEELGLEPMQVLFWFLNKRSQTKYEKEAIIDSVAQAATELSELSLTNVPLWVMLPAYGGFVLHYENYSKIFPNYSRLKSISSRIESSKHSAVMPIAALDLVEMFRDTDKWTDLFPTIVVEAKIIETFDTGCHGDSLHLMYARMHILSPLVAPREYFFLRYCVHVNQNVWYIVDASYDCFHGSTPPCSWKFPSGLLIESLPDGKSMVTWVEHVEVDKALDHPLFKDILSTHHGYGARRWLSCLERINERSLFSVMPGDTNSHQLEGGINVIKYCWTNVLSLTRRMIKIFCSTVTMPGKSELSESTNHSMARIFIRNNNEPGQFRGAIVAGTTTIWLPLTFENLFNFLRDENRRPEWDVLLNWSSAREIGHTLTGTHPGNRVSIIQTSSFKETKMLILQESSADHTGAFIVFAQVHPMVISGAVNGVDTKIIPVLPCGFLISSDGRSSGNTSDGVSTSTSTVQSRRPPGSLLTMGLQFPVKDDSRGATQNRLEAIDFTNYIAVSIIQRLKGLFGCREL